MAWIPIRCRIPELVHRMGRDQQWLANEVGIPKQQLTDYVSMRYLMKLTKAKAIADVLNVQMDELYEWEERHGE